MIGKIRIAVIIICLGICTGLGAHYLLNKESGILVEHPVTIKIPERGIETDTFGIRLLQTALEKEPQASCIVSPFLVSEALLALHELGESPIQQSIDKLGIKHVSPSHTSFPDISMVIGADYGLHFSGKQSDDNVMRLPFRANLPVAMSLFNGALCQNENGVNMGIIDSHFLTRDTRFIVGLHADYTPEMQHPFLEENATFSEFDNADGSLPNICMMRVRANIRHAKDVNGEWEAVALLLKPSHNPQGEPTAFVAILPGCQADKMVSELTAEQLGTIRKALAEAVPTDCCVELPQMRWAIPARNLESQLRRLGLEQLFDTNAQNWKFADQKLGLDAIPEQIRLTLTHEHRQDEHSASVNNAANNIRFNRPFIWFIGDLTTATPPYYMGIVQNL